MDNDTQIRVEHSVGSCHGRLVRPCLHWRASRQWHEKRQPHNRNWARWALLLVSCTMVGCGYSNESLHRSSVRTVYVDMFQSKSFRRGIEFQLTEAVRKQISRSTPYKNTERGKADTIIEGEILEWDEASLGRDFITDRPREMAGTLSVRYRWQDRRTGKLLVDRPLAVTTVQYVPPLREQDYDGYELAVDQMARQIVESMETPW